MQIKKFEAHNMTEALRMIKREFGSEAVILSARSLRKDRTLFDFIQKPKVEVTAATDNCYTVDRKDNDSTKIVNTFDEQAGRAGVDDPGDQNGLINMLQREIRVLKNKGSSFAKKNRRPGKETNDLSFLHTQMLSQGVEEDVILDLVEKIKKLTSSENLSEYRAIKPYLMRVLEDMGVEARPIMTSHGMQKIAVFVGPPGVGKTTTTANLAAIHALRRKNSVGLITLDNHRIAASEQLKVYARIIGIPIEVVSSNKGLKEALKRLREKQLILIDSTRISKGNELHLGTLKEILGRISPLEIHLLLSSTTKGEDLTDIMKRFKAIRVDKLVFTKIDESSTYGSLFSQLIKTKIPISYFVNGRNVPDGIIPATVERLVDMLMDNKREEDLTSGPMQSAAGEENQRERFVANKNSDVFHFSSCKWAKRIKSDNIVVFDSVTDAIKQNFKLCRLCDPDNTVKHNPSARANLRPINPLRKLKDSDLPRQQVHRTASGGIAGTL
ncbi:MAG: flagellar biosynthesis protein FlhF [Thermodesulfobacteriota bacterium]|nr:flagellar biosynthesis protein FlhF [Thermodesulfobacteriota bacterium]